ncbi:hypothetical protein QSI_1364 [Clostridioides difficile P28]|nr:hypothetical protein QSI_1364 [Clostridioides difficile P28]
MHAYVTTDRMQEGDISFFAYSCFYTIWNQWILIVSRF